MADEIDEESIRAYDSRQEIVDGLEKWLKVRLSEVHPAAFFIRGTLNILIQEVQQCGENGEFPWEVLEEKKTIDGFTSTMVIYDEEPK